MPTVSFDACDDSLRWEMLLILSAGCALTLFIVFRLFRASRDSMPTHVGLQLSYLANFWILHWVSMLAYVLPWYCGENASFSLLGARQSLYGLLGFTVAAVLMPYLLKSRRGVTAAPPENIAKYKYGLLTLGLVFYVIGSLLGGSVTGLQAVISGGQAFTVVAIALNIWSAIRKRGNRTVMKWLAISLLFPFATMIRAGFLGFGIQALLPIVIFTITSMPRKNFTRIAVVGLLAAYPGLSLFVTYMRDRPDIRRSVWGEESYSRRLDQMENMVTNFEWFSPTNPQHLGAIAERLNQNYLVGASVVYIDSTKEWAAGRTLWNAALAVIPRILWPGKPSNTSGGLVSQYTGIEFAQGTSVGIGQVMEFYVNFGSGMVFLGFFIFGAVLAWLDSIAIHALISGAVHRFVGAYLVGLSMQQIGGSLMEVIGAAAASLILAWMFKMAVTGREGNQPASKPVAVWG